MSNNRAKIISFRDSDLILHYLDEKAEAEGIDRSDVLRMFVRERKAADADSALERYKKNR